MIVRSVPTELWGPGWMALVLALIRLAQLRARWVRPQIFNELTLRLVQVGHWERVAKLCQASRGMPYIEAVGEVLAEERGRPAAEHPLDREESLRTRFAKSFAARSKALAEPSLLTGLAWLLLLGPLVAFRDALPPAAEAVTYYALLAVSAGLLGGCELLAGVLRRAGAAAGAELMAQLAAVWDKARKDPPADSAAVPPAASEPSGGGITLQIYGGDSLLGEQSFTSSIIKIGRLASAHIGAGEASLSRLHAVIELLSDGKARAIDLGSAEGTFLQGKKITAAFLHEGDEVCVGKLRLVVKRLY